MKSDWEGPIPGLLGGRNPPVPDLGAKFVGPFVKWHV